MKFIMIEKDNKNRDEIIASLIRSDLGWTSIRTKNGDDLFILKDEYEIQEEERKKEVLK